MKKIFIIGATGQLGSALVEQAQLFNFEPVHFSKEELDFTNSEQLQTRIETVKPDVVANATAYHVVPKCEDYPDQAMLVNAIAVYRAAAICRQNNIKFVHYSTDYVFAGEKGLPIAEDEPVSPVMMYGISKAAGEMAAFAAHPEGALVIRTSALYGGGKTGSKSKGGNFVLGRLEEAKGKDVLEIANEQTVNPTFAGDLAEASLLLLQKNPEPGIYHLMNEGHCSWAEFAAEIFRNAEIATQVIPVDRGAKSGTMRRPKFSALQNKKAKKLGVALPSWQEGLVSYFKTLKS